MPTPLTPADFEAIPQATLSDTDKANLERLVLNGQSATDLLRTLREHGFVN